MIYPDHIPSPPLPACLELRDFGFAFGDRTVIRSIDLAVPARGLFTLLGPVAAGKSSLLRLLSGEIVSPRTCQSWGTATYLGAPLGDRGHPALAGQRARFVMGSVLERLVDSLRGRQRLTRAEQRDAARALLGSLALAHLAERLDTPVVELPLVAQRCLSLASTFATAAPLMFADEPTAALDGGGRALVLELLRRMARERAVLVVTHNLEDVRALGGRMALIAGGVLHEAGDVTAFLRSPSSPAGEQFARTGSCSVPSPDAVAEEIDPSVSLPEAAGAGLDSPAPPHGLAARQPPSSSAMTASIRWVLGKSLAGIPRPGLLRELEGDLAALVEEGIRVLVCLEETPPIPAATLRGFGIEPIWLPIPDMRAPAALETASLCGEIERRVEAGDRVAVHCKGGLGRTGTLLTAYFIWRGASKPEALATVRRADPRFVQSTEQLDFLRRFWRERAPEGEATRGDTASGAPAQAGPHESAG